MRRLASVRIATAMSLVSASLLLPRPMLLAAPLNPNDPSFHSNAASNANRGNWSQVVDSALNNPSQIQINTNTLEIVAFQTTPGSPTQSVTIATGTVVDQGPVSQNGLDDWNREIAAFVFPEDLTLGDTLPTIFVRGDRPLALLSRGDIDIDKSIDVSGLSGSQFSPGLGFAGGATGGRVGTRRPLVTFPGIGPGRGLPGSPTSGSGAGFGSDGEASHDGFSNTIRGEPGRSYGNLLERLQAGSSGGGAHASQGGAGGAGGGALELGAVGEVNISTLIAANGGNGGDGDISGDPFETGGGGGGSGGGILVHGNLVSTTNGQLDARGGGGGLGKGISVFPHGGSGGGGRIAVLGLNELYTVGQGGVSNINVGSGFVTLAPMDVAIPGGRDLSLSEAPIIDGGVAVHVDHNMQILANASVTLLPGNVIGNQGLLDIKQNGLLDLNGFNERVGRLAGAGSIELGVGTLTVSGDLNSSFSGEISGLGGLTKAGTGTLTLGAAADYEGETRIQDGTLQLQQGFDTTGSAASTISIDAAGTLRMSGVLSRQLNGAGTFEASGPLVWGQLNSTNGIDFDGTFDLASNQAVLLDADKAQLGAATNLAAGGHLVTVNGAEINAGETLSATGPALIDGDFTNNGEVNGPTAAGESLSFNDNVDGAGSYTGNVEFLQEFSPGNSPAVVSLENLTLTDTSTLEIDLGGLVAGAEHDQLQVSGGASITGLLEVLLIDGFTPSVGDEFMILDVANDVNGEFLGLADGDLVDSFNGVNLRISYQSGDGNDVSLLATSAVPEPSTALLLLAGCLSVVYRRR